MTKRRNGTDPFTAGLKSFARGAALDPEFGLKCKGWGPITAQCLYEAGRLKAAGRTNQTQPHKTRRVLKVSCKRPPR